VAGGQQITSAQGSVTQSASIALVGQAITSATGTIVASTPADVEIEGSESTSAAGSVGSARFISLRSRKVGGGAANRLLAGSAVAATQGIPIPGITKALTGLSIASSTGSLARTRSVTLSGSVVGVFQGTASPTVPGNGFFVPTITLTTSSPSHNITQYVPGYVTGMSLLIQGTLPSTVTTNVENGSSGVTHLVWNQTGGPVTVSGITIAIIPDTEDSNSIPALILAIPQNNWAQINNTTIQSALPSPLPTHNNPNVSVNRPENITEAWSGGAVDTTRNRLIVWGGGHTDYPGNEIYAGSLQTLSMTRIRNYSPNIASVDGANLCSDGAPTSRHTYDAMAYAANTDRVICIAGATTPQGGIDNRIHAMDMGTTTPGWSHAAGNTAWNSAHGFMAEYDPVNGTVWVCDRDGLWEVNTTTLVATRRVTISFNASTDCTAAIDTSRRRFVMFENGGGVFYNSLNSPYTAGTLTSTSVPSGVSHRSRGVIYHPPSDRFIAWGGNSNVYALPGAGGAWTQIATNAGPNFDQLELGTFGRWGYVPNYGVIVLVNGITQNMYVFRP
jgi:hypothetical protein